MPGYKADTSKCTSLMPGDSFTAFNAEQPAAGTTIVSASERVAINEGGPISVEGSFSAAPGAFEIDLMGSDTDAFANFAQEGLGITVLNADGVSFRGEFLNISAKFVLLLIRSRTNAVSVTARIIRRARGVK